MVYKNGASAENEIDAISGATFTSKAVTNGVNAGLRFKESLKEGRYLTMSKAGERLYNGIIKENLTFVLMLGMCPTLAVTTSSDERTWHGTYDNGDPLPCQT